MAIFCGCNRKLWLFLRILFLATDGEATTWQFVREYVSSEFALGEDAHGVLDFGMRGDLKLAIGEWIRWEDGQKFRDKTFEGSWPCIVLKIV